MCPGNWGKPTIEQAKSVIKNATPEVQKAVKSGKIGLSKAQKLAKLPKDQQAAAIDKPIIAPERPRLTEDYGPDADELKAMELAEQADRETMYKMLEANDALATAVKEIERLHLLNAQQEVRITALMNEKNACVKQIKRLEAQIAMQMKKGR